MSRYRVGCPRRDSGGTAHVMAPACDCMVSATAAAAAAVAGAAVTPEVAHSTLTQPMQCIILYSIYMHIKHDS